jgi:hypothetical protein
MLSFWEIDSNQAKKHFDMVKMGMTQMRKKWNFSGKSGQK